MKKENKMDCTFFETKQCIVKITHYYNKKESFYNIAILPAKNSKGLLLDSFSSFYFKYKDIEVKEYQKELKKIIKFLNENKLLIESILRFKKFTPIKRIMLIEDILYSIY